MLFYHAAVNFFEFLYESGQGTQEERKKWLKHQAAEHTYGHDNDDNDAEEAPIDGDDTPITVVSGKRSHCGSKEH